jgi:hypothetical protein
MPWLNAPGVRFNSWAARLKLPQRAAASKSRKPLRGGSRRAMRDEPISPVIIPWYDD